MNKKLYNTDTLLLEQTHVSFEPLQEKKQDILIFLLC